MATFFMAKINYNDTKVTRCRFMISQGKIILIYKEFPIFPLFSFLLFLNK